jgi:hypothetical protein
VCVGGLPERSPSEIQCFGTHGSQEQSQGYQPSSCLLAYSSWASPRVRTAAVDVCVRLWMIASDATSVRVMEGRRLATYSQSGSQSFLQNRPKRVQNGIYISGLSLLNTCVRLRPTGVPLSDAWSLKAGSWSQLTASELPSLYDASAIWDQKTHSVVVMFGMNCPNPSNDAWAWTGSVWTRSILPITARWLAATAVDTNGSILVFGGDNEVSC